MNRTKIPEFINLFDGFKETEDYQFRIKQSAFTSLAKQIISETLKNEPLTNEHLTGLIQMLKAETSSNAFNKYLKINIHDAEIRQKLSDEMRQLGFTGYTGAGRAAIRGLNQNQLIEVKKFLSDAFNISSKDEAKILTDNFDSLNIPELKQGIYSPWLHYINPSIFPIINSSHNDLIQWFEMDKKYSSCIDDYNELKAATGEDNMGTIDFFAYKVKLFPDKQEKFESNEDLALRLLKENADQETIMQAFRKVYKEKKNITDENYIKARVDIYMNLARKLVDHEKDGNVQPVSESGADYQTKVKYWLYAPGRNAKYWDTYFKENIMGIGPNAIGNYQSFDTRDDITKKMKELFGADNRYSNDSLADWQFIKEIKPGDIIIAKKGTKVYLGYGIVQSDHYYDPQRSDYHNLRKVKWLTNSIYPEPDGKIVIKALTDITKYPEYVNKLVKLLNIDTVKQEPIPAKKTIIDFGSSSFWWINANPKYWSIDNFKEGQEQTYTTHNEKGNKRRVYEYFKQLKPGDLIIGYQSTPSLRVKALFEVISGITENDEEGEVITFRIKEFFPYQPTWEELKDNPLLVDCEVFSNNQGSLFKLREDEFNTIVNICKEGISEEIELYSLNDALAEIFLKEDQLKNIIELLEYKKNLILQGPPGTGKTFIAKRLAHLFLGKKDPSKIEMIQFHQSYAYEDFIQGYRPTVDGIFQLQNGIFYDFCLKAQRDPNEKYFFIIDEINRGNLSKIFGELMMLIEHDKRGQQFGIKLAYSGSDSDRFYIPENLYIIGTMNTADRSLAIVDYALRRRFVFVDIKPAFNHPGFENQLKSNNIQESLIKLIKDRMSELNATISEDSNLSKWFAVGHSYFCATVKNPDINWYKNVIKNEIGPLLHEYWFDDEEKAEENIRKLIRD